MKKLAILMTLELTIGAANAGEYTDAVERDRQCAKLGNITVNFYRLKVMGKRFDETLLEIMNGTKKHDSIAFLAITAGYDYRNDSEEDAYMRGWAKCMDGEL